MTEDTVKVMKNIIKSLERNLHIHKDRMEKILSKQDELKKRLNEAEEQVLEMADLQKEYEMHSDNISNNGNVPGSPASKIC
uniref:Uncharacterized protein n=1 Tax=Onchocerca volvulus TaxID=6282 RepID=A0A8R1U2N2_ONCVO